MGEIRRIEVSLSDELVTDIDLAIQDGDYADLSHVVRTALVIWAMERERKLTELRALIDEGLASGEPRDVTDEWFDSLQERAMAKVAERRAAE